MEAKSALGHRIAGVVIRWAVAALLGYAGVVKALDPGQFALDLGGYRLIPAGGTRLLALYLPWVEILCAASLLLRPLRAGAWLIAIALSLGFVVFLGSAWARGLDVSCGCFGSGAAEPIGLLAVARALALLGASGFGLWSELRTYRPGIRPVPKRTESTPDEH